VESNDLTRTVIPGWSEAQIPDVQLHIWNLQIPGSLASLTPRNDDGTLTTTGRGLIAAPMIDAATNIIARRRRTSAARADVCV
jgi:hypothetical protein